MSAHDDDAAAPEQVYARSSGTKWRTRRAGRVSIVGLRAVTRHGRRGGTGTGHSVQIQEAGATVRRVDVEGSLVVGRECEGLVVNDPKVSRRHLVLRSVGDVLTVAA